MILGWFLLGVLAAGLGIMVSEAKALRDPKENMTDAETKSRALLGAVVLVLMVMGGPISFLVVIGLLVSTMNSEKNG